MAVDIIPEWAEALTGTLLKALQERDIYTWGHSRRVADLAKAFAATLSLSPAQQHIVEYVSLFHDIGKIGIPDSVLLKPGRLTESEEALMREHPVKSEQILTPLAHLPMFTDVLPSVRNHHERIDGAGYPDGLFGEYIPLPSRLLLIVDTYDAMTTTRPYRRGLPDEIAYKELAQFAGRQFDEKLVKEFIKAHPTWQKLDNRYEQSGLMLVNGKQKKAA